MMRPEDHVGHHWKKDAFGHGKAPWLYWPIMVFLWAVCIGGTGLMGWAVVSFVRQNCM